MRSYAAFGLPISSGWLLPELCAREDSDPAQVRIGAGAVAPELAGPTARGAFFEVSPGRFLLRMDGVARYLVSDGAEIVIDAAADADEDSVRLFLLGSVFGALLHQRGLLPLHASAIETSKGAVLFAGGSGTGKSALAGVFYSRGYKVIADELCAVDGDSTGSVVFPALPRLLLWPDVVDQLGLWTPNVRPARPNLKKHHVPLREGFAHRPVPVHAIYLLRVTNTSDFGISRIAGVDKFQELIALTFRRQFLNGMNSGSRYIDRIIALARNAALSLLARPADRSLRETADLLEGDFSQ
jgi:hypothetical protein